VNRYEKKVAQAAIKADPICASFDEVFSPISVEIGIDAHEVESVLHRLEVQRILWRRGGPSRIAKERGAGRVGWYEKGDAWPG
jgi:hypothetical protein